MVTMNVVFMFRENTPEETQELVRSQLLRLPGIVSVGRISPDASLPSLRRMWYAEVANDRAAAEVASRLRAHDQIESADIPAERRLLGGAGSIDPPS
jgi:hypothetical protein